MNGIGATIATAAGLFAGTNIDDIIVLAVLFLASRASGTPKPWQIWAGHGAGFTALITISGIAALGLTVVPDEWVGLLGLIPFLLGARGLVHAIHARATGAPVTAAPATSLWSVMTLTIGNGADNLAVYPPVLRSIGTGSAVTTLVVFAAGVTLWCLAASWLSSNKQVIDLIERSGHWIVPAVFMTIGVIIIAGSGILHR